MKRFPLLLTLFLPMLPLRYCSRAKPIIPAYSHQESQNPPFASPEGAVYVGTDLFVSNVGVKAAPKEKDGDGFILHLRNGTMVDLPKWKALKLNAPKGMVALQNTLYVADIDRLVAIDLSKVEIAWTLDFKEYGTMFLNDIAQKDENTLLISGTDIDAVFEVDVQAKSITQLEIEGLNGPNGLLYMSEGNKLICAELGNSEQKGRLVQIDMGNLKVSTLAEVQGSLDGVVELRSGDLLVTDWAVNGIHRINMHDRSVSRFPTEALKGPADLAYNMVTQQLAVPRMLENAVLMLEAVK